jgi:hypothetical protein
MLRALRSHPSSDDEYIATFSRREKDFASTYLAALAVAEAGMIVNRLSGISYCAAPCV